MSWKCPKCNSENADYIMEGIKKTECLCGYKRLTEPPSTQKGEEVESKEQPRGIRQSVPATDLPPLPDPLSSLINQLQTSDWNGKLDAIDQIIALAPHDFPEKELLQLLNEKPLPKTTSGSEIFRQTMDMQNRERYFLFKELVCRLCIVVSPKSSTVAYSIGELLTETRTPIVVSNPAVLLFADKIEQTRIYCRASACLALAIIGSPYADFAKNVIEDIFSDEKESFAVRLNATVLRLVPQAIVSTAETRQLIIRSTQDQIRKKQEEAKQKAEQERVDRIQSERRASKHCIMCGRPLGFLDKLAKRTAHAQCTSFREGARGDSP